MTESGLLRGSEVQGQNLVFGTGGRDCAYEGVRGDRGTSYTHASRGPNGGGNPS